MRLGSLVTGFALLSLSLVACGGKVDEPSPAITPGSNTTTNAPADASGCEGACSHLHDCTTPPDDRDACMKSCGEELPDPAQARIYATCIESLSCATIQEGMFMNYGPIGECYTTAHRH
jgi:hypothetical protein